MAQSNSIASARDRLNLSISAVSSLAQIISLTTPDGLGSWADLTSVFCYITERLEEDRDALEALLAEKVSTPVLEAANA